MNRELDLEDVVNDLREELREELPNKTEKSIISNDKNVKKYIFLLSLHFVIVF